MMDKKTLIVILKCVCVYNTSLSSLNLSWVLRNFYEDISAKNKNETPSSAFHLKLPFIFTWKWKWVSNLKECKNVKLKTNKQEKRNQKQKYILPTEKTKVIQIGLVEIIRSSFLLPQPRKTSFNRYMFILFVCFFFIYSFLYVYI